jgi:enamine deaminase RidA (YjgF/YER057c/UK114 family)
MRRLFALLPAVLLLMPATAQAGARQEATVLMATDPGQLKSQEDWDYADAVVTGDTIYLSGVVATMKPGETDLHPAYVRAFDRIGTTLKRAGASWDDVVEITTFHTDLTTQMPVIVEVKRLFMKEPAPAWTAIGVTRLIPNAGLTEIRVIAKLPNLRQAH